MSSVSNLIGSFEGEKDYKLCEEYFESNNFVINAYLKSQTAFEEAISLIDEKNFFIEDSSIEGAGKGLFNKVEFDFGAPLLEYKGVITKKFDISEKKGWPWDHMVDLDESRMIVPYSKKLLAQYVNYPSGEASANCFLHVHKEKVYVVALRPLRAYEELFIMYDGFKEKKKRIAKLKKKYKCRFDYSSLENFIHFENVKECISKGPEWFAVPPVGWYVEEIDWDGIFTWDWLMLKAESPVSSMFLCDRVENVGKRKI